MKVFEMVSSYFAKGPRQNQMKLCQKNKIGGDPASDIPAPESTAAAAPFRA